MPVVPVAGKAEQAEWECIHCNHSWQGKPKGVRTNSGNPTCSSCGRRSGSQQKSQSVSNTESEKDHSKNEPDDQVASALLGLALGTVISRLTEENQDIM